MRFRRCRKIIAGSELVSFTGKNSSLSAIIKSSYSDIIILLLINLQVIFKSLIFLCSSSCPLLSWSVCFSRTFGWPQRSRFPPFGWTSLRSCERMGLFWKINNYSRLLCVVCKSKESLAHSRSSLRQQKKATSFQRLNSINHDKIVTHFWWSCFRAAWLDPETTNVFANGGNLVRRM